VQDDAFEWDDAKAAENLAKHGVGFATARAVFRDPFAIERLDDRGNYGEDRFVTIGMVDGRLLSVACTMRGDIVRIISARGAEPYERRQYHEENR
jgi:uncharacterized DUF497 family protein